MSEPQKAGWLSRLKHSLTASRQQLSGKLSGLFSRQTVDDDFIEELETILIQADCGMQATEHLLTQLKQQAKKEKLDNPADWQYALSQQFSQLTGKLNPPALSVEAHQPFIILLCGINGAGKTTTIGKLANLFLQQGKTVLLAAGDTFRAAAVEQLKAWGEKNQVGVIAQKEGDPAAVVFDAISAAKARKIDVLIADTAGRLPTQQNLMQELAKIKRVIQKAEPTAPHATWLVLDGTVGQNSVSQVALFDKAIGLSGLVLTKLDGTAKGGAIAAIAQEHPVPLYFIGIGEKLDDIKPFSAEEFSAALFE